jgi:GH35 family endo-1,4-beta-xylanase
MTTKQNAKTNLIAKIISGILALILAACSLAPAENPLTTETQPTLLPNTPTYTATASQTSTVEPTATIEPTPTVEPTLSPEQALAEFKESAEYKQGLQDYLDAMGLSSDVITITTEKKTINDSNRYYIVVNPNVDKLDLDARYLDLYKPAPLFIYRVDELGNIQVQPIAEKDLGELMDLKIANTYYWGGNRQELFACAYDYGVMSHRWIKSQSTKDSPIDFSYMLKQDIPFSHNYDIKIFTWGIWPQDVPDWFKQIKDPQEMTKILINYISEFANFAKEQGIESIVLLNEKDHYRNPDPIKRVLGNDYDVIIFETFNAIYPDCELIYNDFENRTVSEQRYSHTKAVASKLKAYGLEAIGFQLHDPISDDEKAANDIRAMLEETGLDGYATELDDNIYNNNSPTRFFDQALSYRKKIRAAVNGGVKGILLWGYDDSVNYFELRAGKTNNPRFSKNADPMTRSEDGTPKPSYYAFLSTLWELSSENN